MSDDLSAPVEYEVPEGFVLMNWRRGFARQLGPLYRKMQDGKSIMGFRVEEQHTNGMANAHGGMLMSFADMAWGQIVSFETSSYWVTVRLTLDFLSGARLNDWIEGAGEVVSTDGGLFVIRGRIWSEERTIVTGVGIFKPVAKREPRPGERAFAASSKS